MIILGIDPGYAIVGWGLVRYEHARYTPLRFGAILTKAETPFQKRLLEIYRDMGELIDSCRPDVMSLEKLYFKNNQKTAIDVAQARGVILLAAGERGVPLFEYTPLQVKSAVTGFGRAQKNQVMEMTRRLLGLREVPRPDDTADALALAICHAQMNGTRLKTQLAERKGE